ncbi:MAG TPA: sigma-54 dependent transcriptional regulator, partial [Thermodesulfobacteriota bacterium]|nr:sigma-54 dependent transcriptional regulator [Thermodesulfobacteriota bacterium]
RARTRSAGRAQAGEGMAEKTRVLVVDDEPSVCNYLRTLLGQYGYHAVSVQSGDEAVRQVQTFQPAVVVLDVLMPGKDGLRTLEELKTVRPEVPVIMLSAHGHASTIVKAMKLGAADFLNKPFDPEELNVKVMQVLERVELATEVRSLRAQIQEQNTYQLLFGQSERMREVRQIIDQVAKTDVTVLIRGESGTGKELVARTLHAQSNRKDKPFVKINCAALPEELLESELFGYEKGAFTGAYQRKPGKFELANHGTIFLDEISEMHPALQAKLLQVLQDGEFSRLGGEGDINVDVRVLAATNRDLQRAVREGSFREDLYYRLNVVSVWLPPLRERADEIPMLVDYFLDRYSQRYNRPRRPLSEETMRLFMSYHWPGNVRELENMIKRIVVLGNESAIQTEFALRSRDRAPAVPAAPVTGAAAALPGLPQAPGGGALSLKEIGRRAAKEAERAIIAQVLQRTRWNRKEAAEILRISYKALLYKIKENELDRAPL